MLVSDQFSRKVVLLSIVVLHIVLFFVFRPITRMVPDSRPYMVAWVLPSLEPRIPPKITSLPGTAPTPRSVPAKRVIMNPARTDPLITVPETPVTSSAATTDENKPETVTPSLNLDAVRSQVHAMEKSRVKSTLEIQQEDQRAKRTVEVQIAEAAKRGARKDCQTAYSGAGLLAVIPLLYDTVTDKGCKWK